MELETKAKVEDLEEIKSRLITLGAVFSKKQVQNDAYFKPKGSDGLHHLLRWF